MAISLGFVNVAFQIDPSFDPMNEEPAKVEGAKGSEGSAAVRQTG